MLSLPPLRNRNFRYYLSGQVILLIGTWLQMTVQGWLAGYSAEHLSTPIAILINDVRLVIAAALMLLLRPALRQWGVSAPVAALQEMAPAAD